MSGKDRRTTIRIDMEIIGSYAEVRVFSDPILLTESERQSFMENLEIIKRVIRSLNLKSELTGYPPLMTNANIETRKIHQSKGCLCKKKRGAKALPGEILHHSHMEEK